MVQQLPTLDSMYDTGILYMGSRSGTGNSSFRFEEWYWNSILWVQGVVREFFIKVQGVVLEFSTLGPRSGTGILHLGSKCGIGIHYFG